MQPPPGKNIGIPQLVWEQEIYLLPVEFRTCCFPSLGLGFPNYIMGLVDDISKAPLVLAR